MHLNIVSMCIVVSKNLLFLMISPNMGEFQLHLLNKFYQQNVKLQIMWKKY